MTQRRLHLTTDLNVSDSVDCTQHGNNSPRSLVELKPNNQLTTPYSQLRLKYPNVKNAVVLPITQNGYLYVGLMYDYTIGLFGGIIDEDDTTLLHTIKREFEEEAGVPLPFLTNVRVFIWKGRTAIITAVVNAKLPTEHSNYYPKFGKADKYGRREFRQRFLISPEFMYLLAISKPSPIRKFAICSTKMLLENLFGTDVLTNKIQERDLKLL